MDLGVIHRRVTASDWKKRNAARWQVIKTDPARHAAKKANDAQWARENYAALRERRKRRDMLRNAPTTRTRKERAAIKTAQTQDLKTLVLSLNRWQLAGAYRLISHKEPHAVSLVAQVAALLEHPVEGGTRAACAHQLVNLAAIRREEEFRRTSGAAMRKQWTKRLNGKPRAVRSKQRVDRVALRARLRLLRLTSPDYLAKQRAYAKANKDRANADKRAKYAALTPAQKRAHIAAQEARLKARLLADPEAKAAFLERKRIQQERRLADPAKRARELQMIERRKERNRKLVAERGTYYSRVVKHDPAKLARFRERAVQAGRRRKLRAKLAAAPLQVDSMKAALRKIIGYRVAPQERDDLMSELLAEILSGNLTLEKLADRATLGRYIRQANKLLAETSGQQSLDEVQAGTESLTRLDTLADDQPHF